MTKLIVAVRNFENTPLKHRHVGGVKKIFHKMDSFQSHVGRFCCLLLSCLFSVHSSLNSLL